MDKLPMISYWKGQPVRDLSHEDLVEAITELGEENKQLREREYRKNIDFVRHMRHQRYMQEFYPRRQGGVALWGGGFLWGVLVTLIVVLIW